MSTNQDLIFRTLADPTRRALFERLCREGEITVGALTAGSGVSQPVVSRHLAMLKQAGLVRDRPAVIAPQAARRIIALCRAP
jgi:DNA-binding transcriptional ArsR family regulator